MLKWHVFGLVARRLLRIQLLQEEHVAPNAESASPEDELQR